MNPSGKPSEDGYMTRSTNILVKTASAAGDSYSLYAGYLRRRKHWNCDYLWLFSLNQDLKVCSQAIRHDHFARGGVEIEKLYLISHAIAGRCNCFQRAFAQQKLIEALESQHLQSVSRSGFPDQLPIDGGCQVLLSRLRQNVLTDLVAAKTPQCA